MPRNWGIPIPRERAASVHIAGATDYRTIERHTRARGRDVERDLIFLALGWAAGVASAILFVVEFAK